MRIHSVLSALLVTLGLMGTARADVNLLINGGLEMSPDIELNWQGFATDTPLTNNTALPGWTIVSGSVDNVPDSYWEPSEGSYSLDLIGTPGVGSISQTVATTAAAAYFLTFDLAANPQVGRHINEKGTTKQLLVEALAADGVTVLNSQIFQVTDGTRSTSDMQYIAESFTFTASGASSTVRLSALLSLNLPEGITNDNVFTGPAVDNLVLQPGAGSPPTPEPASLSIWAAGGCGLLLRRRQRKVLSAVI